jgi:hypothetical protein
MISILRTTGLRGTLFLPQQVEEIGGSPRIKAHFENHTVPSFLSPSTTAEPNMGPGQKHSIYLLNWTELKIKNSSFPFLPSATLFTM